MHVVDLAQATATPRETHVRAFEVLGKRLLNSAMTR